MINSTAATGMIFFKVMQVTMHCTVVPDLIALTAEAATTTCTAAIWKTILLEGTGTT